MIAQTLANAKNWLTKELIQHRKQRENDNHVVMNRSQGCCHVLDAQGCCHAQSKVGVEHYSVNHRWGGTWI